MLKHNPKDEYRFSNYMYRNSSIIWMGDLYANGYIKVLSDRFECIITFKDL